MFSRLLERVAARIDRPDEDATINEVAHRKRAALDEQHDRIFVTI